MLFELMSLPMYLKKHETRIYVLSYAYTYMVQGQVVDRQLVDRHLVDRHLVDF
jgi:hypothetical protein